MYDIIKHAHMLLAVLTGTALICRILLLAIQSKLLNNKLLILGFMAIDISLVALGVGLAIMLPNKEIVLANGWLSAKIIAWFVMFTSVVYGVKIASKQPIRIASVSFGFVLYIYILAVAHNHSPLFF